MLQLCVCQDMKHSGSLESTQEAIVARSELLRLLRALQTSRASYLDIRTMTHELISLACVQPRSQVLSPTRRETLVGFGHASPRIWEITNKQFGGGADKCEICLYKA